MTMTRDNLRTLIHNPAFAQAIRAKIEVDEMRKDMCAALKTLRAVNVSEAACDELQSKIDEYNKISAYYGNMLEDLWNVSWHWESTMEKYLDCDDSEIDELPDCIKAA